MTATSEQLVTREKIWQEHLKQKKFYFPKDQLGMITSMQHFKADCQLHIIYDPPPQHHVTFTFVHEKNEPIAIEGHFGTVFRTFNEKLYFARFGDVHPQCIVLAYDLTTGKKLWETGDLSRFGPIGRSAYSNEVMMRLSQKNEVPDEPEGASVVVTGREGFGDYIAILDRKTGAVLAHKIYRTNFKPTSRGGFGGKEDKGRGNGDSDGLKFGQ